MAEYNEIISKASSNSSALLQHFYRAAAGMTSLVQTLVENGARYFYDEFVPGQFPRTHVKEGLETVLARCCDDELVARLGMNMMARRDLNSKWYLDLVLEQIPAPLERTENRGMLTVELEFRPENYSKFKHAYLTNLGTEFEYNKA